MVLIPSGKFTMGASPGDYPEQASELDKFALSLIEGPRQVTISHGFYMARTEVTKAQWNEVWKRAAAGYGYWWLSRVGDGSTTGPDANQPVVVGWDQALQWCNAKSELEGLEPAYHQPIYPVGVYRGGVRLNFRNEYVKWNAGYRLPTEAEWEYACRAGTTTSFYAGKIVEQTAEACSPLDLNLDKVGWYCGNSDDKIHPVGQKLPNAWGLYDMHGNVWEWCWDWLDFFFEPTATDPYGPSFALPARRVIRGGSLSDHPFACRASQRGSVDIDDGNHPTIGFRVILPVVISARTTISGEEKQTIEMQTARTTYGACPAKLPGKTGLVVITHGWQPAWQPVNVQWVDDMAKTIEDYLVAHNITTWQVWPYKWIEGARPSLRFGLSGAIHALNNGRKEGISLGKYVLSQGWEDVHFISHSAGASVAQGATDAIREVSSRFAGMDIHLTFLDPFVGFDDAGRTLYGRDANWADHYFAHDFWTSGGFFPYTEGPINNTYNVDVTWVDPNKERTQVAYLTARGIVSDTCLETVSSHDWPIRFYVRTITNSWPDAKGFGFPLSKIGGSLGTVLGVGKDKLEKLGTPDAPCAPLNPGTPVLANPALDFARDLSIVQSPTGKKEIFGTGLALTTDSPAWVAVSLPITNTVNLLTLEAAFTSAKGAEGLFTVYWGTNTIGSLDERVTPVGLQKYTFPLPETATSGMTRMLGFRLDPFSNVRSSVNITNVALGFRGLREPFSLSFTGQYKDGIPILQLSGLKGFTYTVESSTDLTNWTTVARLANTDGIVRFTVPNENNAPARFYRAVGP
ncbi:MAG: formylglycine-generating enzyme family protein [Candidatus Liptonbacteria bacterium]|nr:formylglycine-generating enzyme family protein [Candidatus Liptonbacteria bacterium]